MQLPDDPSGAKFKYLIISINNIHLSAEYPAALQA